MSDRGCLQEFGRRRDHAHVADNRLENHRGDLPAVALERSLQSRWIVVLQHQRVAGGALSDARRIGHGQRRRRAAGRDQQAIDVAMIIAGEFDDQLAAGESASEPQGAHRGFGAGVD